LSFFIQSGLFVRFDFISHIMGAKLIFFVEFGGSLFTDYNGIKP